MAEQQKKELLWLLTQVKDCDSFLEIGSRIGDVISLVAEVTKPGTRICSIDLGYDPDGFQQPHREQLEERVGILTRMGYNVELLFANSHDAAAVAWAKERAPFDLIFIDGDHTLDGVSQDWENYGPLGRRVAFHDIFALTLGTRPFWKRLRKSNDTVTYKGVGSDMGIGIVERE